MQAFYASPELLIRVKCDPRPRDAWSRFCSSHYMGGAKAYLSAGLARMTGGRWGRKLPTIKEQSDALDADMLRIKAEMNLPGEAARTVKDTLKMDATREELESNNEYAQHIEGCSAGSLKDRAAREAAEKDAKLTEELRQATIHATLGKRRPSAMLNCTDNDQAEATMKHISAHYPWLECRRAPLPSAFRSNGLQATWQTMGFGSLLITFLFLFFPAVSFNGLMFGLATRYYYWVCDQPLPDLSLEGHHDAEDWTGTGVFCGTTGIINSLLVSMVLTIIPATLCILVSDYAIVLKFEWIGEAWRGEVSATRLQIFVAYCACGYDILAVTIGILTGGHVGKLFTAWADHGFAGMVGTFGQRALDASPYFFFYIMLRVCVLTPLFKLVRLALRGADLLRLVCWVISAAGLAVTCPLAAITSWTCPSCFDGGATGMCRYACSAVEAAVDWITSRLAYYLLCTLFCVLMFIYAVVYLLCVGVKAGFTRADAGMWGEVCFAFYQTRQRTLCRLRRWTGTQEHEVEPVIAAEEQGQHDHSSDGRTHFEAHEYIGVVAMLVYYPATSYSATAPLVTLAGAIFLVLLAMIICFYLRTQCHEGSPSLGQWVACSVRCRVWAGLLRLAVTAAILKHKGYTLLQCLPLLVAAVLYGWALWWFISPALRELAQLPYREGGAWGSRVPLVHSSQVAEDCWIFPTVRDCSRWVARLGTATRRVLHSTADAEGTSAAALEEGRAGPARSALGNITNSSAHHQSGPKGPTIELN